MIFTSFISIETTPTHELGLSLYTVYIQYTVATFNYVEGGPDREAPEVVWNTSSYIEM